MSIKSIDMQVLVQKVSDVARIRQVEQTEADRRQQEHVQVISQETNTNSKVIKETEQGKTRRMDKNDEKGGKRQGKQGQEQPDQQNHGTGDEKIFKCLYKGNNIDIKI